MLAVFFALATRASLPCQPPLFLLRHHEHQHTDGKCWWKRCQRLYCVHTDLPSKASHLFDCLDLGWLEVLVSVHRPGPSHLFYCLDPG